MKYILLAFLIIILLGCVHPNREPISEDRLKEYYKSLVNTVDNTDKLESFKFIKLDTISLSQIYLNLSDTINMLRKKNRLTFNQLLNEAENFKNEARTEGDLDTKTFDFYNKKAIEKLNEIKRLRKEDSLITIDWENVNKLRQKSNSTEPVAYNAKCVYVIIKRNQSIVKDTAFIFLNLNFQILKKEEKEKMLKEIYKPVSAFSFN